MNMKRILCTVLALTLAAACLLFGGCSTPSVAMQVDNKVYEMGDYLAYMYGTMYTDSTAYMYLYYYGEDALSQKVTYGEDSKEVTLSEYIVNTTQDNMIRQKALEDLMASHGISWDADELKTVEEEIKKLKTDQFLPFGFTNERYINMYKAMALNELSLFNGLYDEGGKREVSDDDERKWFDEHYYSYKIIEISLMKDSKELSTDEIDKIQTQLEGYLDLYTKNGANSGAFDVAYRQYLADTAEDTDDKEETAEETETEEKEPETADRIDTIDEDMDENLLKVIKELKEGEIGIKTYQQGGTNKTMALILRMDPEAERGKDEDGNDIDFYVESHSQILQHMKHDELKKEIDEKVKALKDKVTLNDRAVKAADPKELI